METWKDVDWLEGYRGIMQVSDAARVRRLGYSYSCVRSGTKMNTTKPDIIMAQHVAQNGYVEVSAMINGKRKKFNVHRLVGRAFVPGYAPGLTINHINGIKTDNRPDNLEWCTLARNTQMQWEEGLVDLRGDNHPNRKLSSGQVRIIRRLLAKGATAGELATLARVNVSTIYLIRDGKRWNSI